MEIEFIGKDPGSQVNGSPTLYRTDRDSFLVQGWTVCDAAALAKMGVCCTNW
ncbi:hypothetical protein GCM10010124_37700 [Pilimelia terevasa]|uniref:Uncharacterized protein n=1 Tax=Pilimelia terevasa TaxID=53372 RepID=A0A8J3BTJ8_9ACTN|nr:hypothetical protein [Pilimelia terevasa]GGK41305.1 hypothetical protein GCM10010124_37700 [Pilimelia terevasa]